MCIREKPETVGHNSILLRPAETGRQPALPPFIAPQADLLDPLEFRRARLWDLHSSLHCSIIGTCFSTAELRQVLKRIGCQGVDGSSDHNLHGRAVAIAASPSDGAKVLHKALDRKYAGTVAKFAAADCTEDLLGLWRGFVERGEIPGAYWAVLTHPAAGEGVVQTVFGEVHMLSHLVGAANRADIRRLRELEEENAALKARAEREEAQFRQGIAKRDRTIQDLKAVIEDLATRSATISRARPAPSAAAAEALTADVDRKLKQEEAAGAKEREKLAAALSELAVERELRIQAEQRALEMERELEIVDASFLERQTPEEEDVSGWAGGTVLYVGGRQRQVLHLRKIAQECGADFLHHDGGIEEASGLLPSLVAQADAIMFPVDCVSHSAVTVLKKLCRQMGKPYRPLRSSGLSSFAAALSQFSAGSKLHGVSTSFHRTAPGRNGAAFPRTQSS
jgi:hypothetical protein